MGNFDDSLILAVETSGRLGSVALAQGDKLLAETRFSGPMRHSAEIFPAITDLLSRFNKKPEQIEHVYISIGPGSFTGLRIAVTFAKTMALANNSKIVAVDTLDCIAANMINLACTPNAVRCTLLLPNERLAIILDAKRGQFFIAVYEQSVQSDLPAPASCRRGAFPQKRESSIDCPLIKILPDSLMTAEEFLAQFTDKPTCGERSRTIMLTGEGLVFYKDKFAHKNIRVLDEKFWNPSAANVHKLGLHKARLGEFADPLTITPNYIRGPDVAVKRI